MWYCAHAIFWYKQDSQESVLVHENVYLIEAVDADEAFRKAEILCRENEDFNEDGHLFLNDKPVQYVFAGIRKLITVLQDELASVGKLHSELEVTYSEFEVDTVEEVEKLASGDPTELLYRE